MEYKENKIMLNHVLRYSLDMICIIDDTLRFIQVSHAFNSILGYKEEELEGLSIIELVQPEDRANVLQNLKTSKEGNLIIQFENSVTSKHNRQISLSWSVVWQEEENYFFCVARDISALKQAEKEITEVVQACRTVEQQAARLNTILESITDAFFTIDTNWNFTYTNTEFDNVFHVEGKEFIGRCIWDIYPEEIDRIFYQEYHRAVNTGQSVHFESYLERLDKWLEVKAYPSEEGLSVYFSDITLQVLQKQELEKLSLVASKTVNSVVIMGMEVRIEWANESFTRLTGYTLAEAKGKTPFELLFGEETDRTTAQRIKEKMVSGEPVKEEILIYMKSGEKRWFEVEVTPVYDETGELVEHICMQTDITEKVKTKEELEKLSLVASKAVHGVIITNAQGLTEWVNEGFTHMTGYTLPEMEGRKPGTIMQGPETDPATVKRMSELLKSGKSFTEEILNYKKSGEKFYINEEITPIFNEEGVISRFIAVLSDVTERKSREEEFKLLSLVASKTSNSIIIMDAAGRVEWVNEGFTTITGYTLEEVAGKIPRDFLSGPETNMAEVERIIKKLDQGVSFNSNIINYRKSGEAFWFAMDVSPVSDAAGHITHFVAIQRDITSQKEAEANLVKLSQSLYQQNKDLEHFTYIVSHNLRAPVSNIMGCTNLLTKVDRNSNIYELSLSNLKLSVHSLDTVLRDLNNVLSIRDSKGNLERERVNVNMILQQALTFLKERLERIGGKVSVDIDEGFFVWANKAYLYSIFYNLLSNAIKYRSDNRKLEVVIQCALDSKKGVTISVADNGSGFDMKKAKDKVFKLYSRFHHNKEGRGIGLYLVKAHLEAMGGEIEVSSEVGAGTKFLIYLPKA